MIDTTEELIEQMQTAADEIEACGGGLEAIRMRDGAERLALYAKENAELREALRQAQLAAHSGGDPLTAATIDAICDIVRLAGAPQ